MRLSIIKHLFVFFFIFSLLEKTGVSVLSLVFDNNKQLTECLFEDDEDDTSSRTETKETEIKEYWIVQSNRLLPVPSLYAEQLHYAKEDSKNHLAYFPTVPTPPPDFHV